MPASPQLRVSHLSDSLIVAQVGMYPAFSQLRVPHRRDSLIVAKMGMHALHQPQPHGCPIFAAVSSRLRWECRPSTRQLLQLFLPLLFSSTSHKPSGVPSIAPLRRVGMYKWTQPVFRSWYPFPVEVES